MFQACNSPLSASQDLVVQVYTIVPAQALTVIENLSTVLGMVVVVVGGKFIYSFKNYMKGMLEFI